MEQTYFCHDLHFTRIAGGASADAKIIQPAGHGGFLIGNNCWKLCGALAGRGAGKCESPDLFRLSAANPPQMRITKRGRLFQPIARHPVKPDMAHPKQAHHNHSGAARQHPTGNREAKSHPVQVQRIVDEGSDAWPGQIAQKPQVRREKPDQQQLPRCYRVMKDEAINAMSTAANTNAPSIRCPRIALIPLPPAWQ